MKALKNPLPFFLFFIAIIAVLPSAIAQKSVPAKEVAVKNGIDSQQYIFHAQSVLPMRGSQRFLTTDYTVTVSKDTVVSDLPFFGRAYSAPMNPSDGGIKFTSASFNYQVVARKKGGWDISIQPKDVPDAERLTMTVFKNGAASLQVISTNRQSISFNGYVTGKGK